MNSLKRKLAEMMVNPGKAKPYYCEVEYLESDGTAYIDTGLYRTNTALEDGDDLTTYSFKGVIEYTALGVRRLMGDTGQLNGFWGIQSNNRFETGQTSSYTASVNTKYRIDYTVTATDLRLIVYSLDGTELVNYLRSVTTPTKSTTTTFDIFALGGSYKCSNTRVYKYQISINNKIVGDYIPVLDWNMTPCMYDKVSGELLYNAADSGSFTYGREIHYVDYLESSKTQYIDTGVNIATATDEVEFKYETQDTTNYKWIFGEHDDNKRFGLGTGDGTNKHNVAYYNTTAKITDEQFYGIHVYKANLSGVFMDDTKIVNYTSFSSTSTLYLFNLNLNATDYMVSAKIYYYKHKRNGELIRDYKPAVDENGVGYLLDRVTHTIFDNAGTGIFSYPPLRLQYIESTGTQYIDTGVKLTNNHAVEIDYQLTVASQSRKGLYGGLVTSRHGALLSPSNSFLEAGYGAGNDYYQLGMPNTNRHVLKQDKNKLYFDGILKNTFTEATFTQSSTAPLGNFNYTNYNPASAKYYLSKWWENDVLIRVFIPARTESKLGFYDVVNKVFYENAGSGTFVTGKVYESHYF